MATLRLTSDALVGAIREVLDQKVSQIIQGADEGTLLPSPITSLELFHRVDNVQQCPLDVVGQAIAAWVQPVIASVVERRPIMETLHATVDLVLNFAKESLQLRTDKDDLKREVAEFGGIQNIANIVAELKATKYENDKLSESLKEQQQQHLTACETFLHASAKIDRESQQHASLLSHRDAIIVSLSSQLDAVVAERDEFRARWEKALSQRSEQVLDAVARSTALRKGWNQAEAATQAEREHFAKFELQAKTALSHLSLMLGESEARNQILVQGFMSLKQAHTWAPFRALLQKASSTRGQLIVATERCAILEQQLIDVARQAHATGQ